MKKLTNYRVTVDTDKKTASFCAVGSHVDACKVWGNAPRDMATLYRAVAMYFLELAHLFDHSSDFCAPDYTEEERTRQMQKACDENPVNLFM